MAASELHHRLERQTSLFHRLAGCSSRFPDRLSLLLYEWLAQSWPQRWLMLLTWLPGLSRWAKSRLQRQIICPFLGQETPERIGCLIHPARWSGEEHRPRVAFQGFRGLACDQPDYLCPAARQFQELAAVDQRQLIELSTRLDWYAFSEQNRQSISPSRHPQESLTDARHRL